ncbi:hypothetical protein BLOT_007082 [Blomia tropicalis]|nr:hypothetical protein BLOT_007082 [Blomia tropicalis]
MVRLHYWSNYRKVVIFGSVQHNLLCYQKAKYICTTRSTKAQTSLFTFGTTPNLYWLANFPYTKEPENNNGHQFLSIKIVKEFT